MNFLLSLSLSLVFLYAIFLLYFKIRFFKHLLHLFIQSYEPDIGLMVRLFASGPGDLGSIPVRLSFTRYISRVKWSNPGKGVAPSPTPRCSSYRKGTPLGHPQLRSPTLLLLPSSNPRRRWCNGYCRRKWTRWPEFKSFTTLFASHIVLIPLGKV